MGGAGAGSSVKRAVMISAFDCSKIDFAVQSNMDRVVHHPNVNMAIMVQESMLLDLLTNDSLGGDNLWGRFAYTFFLKPEYSPRLMADAKFQDYFRLLSHEGQLAAIELLTPHACSQQLESTPTFGGGGAVDSQSPGILAAPVALASSQFSGHTSQMSSEQLEAAFIASQEGVAAGELLLAKALVDAFKATHKCERGRLPQTKRTRGFEHKLHLLGTDQESDDANNQLPIIEKPVSEEVISHYFDPMPEGDDVTAIYLFRRYCGRIRIIEQLISTHGLKHCNNIIVPAITKSVNGVLKTAVGLHYAINMLKMPGAGLKPDQRISPDTMRVAIMLKQRELLQLAQFVPGGVDLKRLPLFSALHDVELPAQPGGPVVAPGGSVAGGPMLPQASTVMQALFTRLFTCSKFDSIVDASVSLQQLSQAKLYKLNTHGQILPVLRGASSGASDFHFPAAMGELSEVRRSATASPSYIFARLMPTDAPSLRALMGYLKALGIPLHKWIHPQHPVRRASWFAAALAAQEAGEDAEQVEGAGEAAPAAVAAAVEGSTQESS